MGRSGMWAARAVVGVGALALLATSCSLLPGSDDRSPTPSQSSSGGSPSISQATGPDGLPKPVAQKRWALVSKTSKAASRDGGPFLQASVYGVYRDGDQARLALGVTVTGDNSQGLSARLTDLFTIEHGSDDPSLDSTGLTLVDSAKHKAYLVARDAQGKCLCPDSPEVGAGITTLMISVHAAPEGKSIDVVLPKFGVLPGIPITDGQVPTSISSPPASKTSPRPGKLPRLFVVEPGSKGPAARLPVVDIELPTANVDASVTKRKGKVVLAADVLFKFDKATLTSKAKARIAETAQILRKNATGTVQVNGYTDAKGSNAYNLKLSKRRAAAVRAELAKSLTGSGLKLVPHGYGEANPTASNKDPRGQALNRRVETVYKTKPGAGSSPASTDEPGSSTTGPPTPGKAYVTKNVTLQGKKFPVEMYGVQRHGGLATLEFGVKVPPEAGLLRLRGLFSRGSFLDDTVDGVDLVDRTNSRRYLSGKYVEQCFCSTDFGRWNVGPGQTLYLSATYVAPPDGVEKVDIVTPRTGTFRNVPVLPA